MEGLGALAAHAVPWRRRPSAAGVDAVAEGWQTAYAAVTPASA
jgi:hypothetical protein